MTSLIKTTWYKPETTTGARKHACYCKADAVGRTLYWDGVDVTVKWQCEKHIPAEPVTYRAVAS